MKFKLDENFGDRAGALFAKYQHDVETVRSQRLSGCSDDELFRVCAQEGRCLVTLDLDFASVLRFPPADASGVAVIRASRNPKLSDLERLVESLLIAVQAHDIRGSLWIVEHNRIRVHQVDDDRF